jgi:DNA mismatch repair ATPase MutS
VNRNSHGLKVAQLAGMPETVVDVASKALQWMHDKDSHFLADREGLKCLGASFGRDEERVVPR